MKKYFEIEEVDNGFIVKLVEASEGIISHGKRCFVIHSDSILGKEMKMIFKKAK